MSNIIQIFIKSIRDIKKEQNRNKKAPIWVLCKGLA